MASRDTGGHFFLPAQQLHLDRPQQAGRPQKALSGLLSGFEPPEGPGKRFP